MGANKYYIKIDRDIVARYMTLECATILIKAMMETYWRDASLIISIGREDEQISAD